MSKIDEILEYWIDPPHIDPEGFAKPKLWSASSPDLDNTISSFGEFLHQKSLLGWNSAVKEIKRIRLDRGTFGQ